MRFIPSAAGNSYIYNVFENKAIVLSYFSTTQSGGAKK